LPKYSNSAEKQKVKSVQAAPLDDTANLNSV